MRSLPEQVDWRWGAAALGAMAYEADDYKLGDKLQGAQNWWAHFADTGQLQDYPLSIAGTPASDASATGGSQACDQREKFGKTCNCIAGSREVAFVSEAHAAAPASEVGLMIQNLLQGRQAESPPAH